METNDFASFTSQINLTQIEASENDPENSSRRAQKKNKRGLKSNQKLKSSTNEQQSFYQVSQNQHSHDNFNDMNRNDAGLGPEVQLGSTGHKKVKNETFQAEDNDLSHRAQSGGRMEEEDPKPIYPPSILDIASLFAELKHSKGKSRALYKHHSAKQEDVRSIHQSLQEILIQGNKSSISSMLSAEEREREERDKVKYKFSDFDLKDYMILEIIGKGGYGLIIRMRKGKDDIIVNDMILNHVVLKLCQKGSQFSEHYEKRFINEVILLSVSQKTKQHSLHREFGRDLDYVPNKAFETDKYYGMFLKPGVGTLYDFKNYLKKRKTQLTGQELFFIAWSLLDNYGCLNKVKICHRDVKPANIVLDEETFSPEFIDFGFASGISKAKGNAGTEKYRMQDFPEMIEFYENNEEDQIVSNDYFAIGKTILEIAFPDIEFENVGYFWSGIKKLRLSKEKKIIADMIKICMFQRVKAKKGYLKQNEKSYFSTDYWNVEDQSERERFEYIYENFNPNDISSYARKFKEKHLRPFNKYMANIRDRNKERANQKLHEITQGLASEELQGKTDEDAQGELEQNLKGRNFDEEEQYMKNNFIKYPEGTINLCYEIIYDLMEMEHQTRNPQLYSTLMIVLSYNDFLDDAIALGEKALVEDDDWIFLNNLAFLERKRNLRDQPAILSNENGPGVLLSNDKYRDLFIDDLTDICRCASGSGIRASVWTQERSETFGKEEIVLTDFDMCLHNQESYIYMNYCYMKAFEIDAILNEPTRTKIKKFVYGINISERGDILHLLQLTNDESFLIALMSFCKIFGGITLDKRPELRIEAQLIIELKKDLTQWLDEKRKRAWDYLLNKWILANAMVGFIILYNLRYDLKSKFDVYKWLDSEEAKKLKAALSNENLNQRFRALRAKQEEKWSSQRFLDSVLAFLRGISGEKIEIPLDFEEENDNEISCLTIFGRKLDSIFLPHPAIRQNSHHLLIDFEQNSISISAVQIRFGLLEDDFETIQSFFANLNQQRIEKLERLKLEFYNYDKNFSNKALEEISNRLDIPSLKELKINMVDRISITDEGFRTISQLISTKSQLEYLSLKFSVCSITSKAIFSLAKNIKGLQKLQKLTLIFQYCSGIESESFEILWDTMEEMSELQAVRLYFAACSGVISLKKSTGLSKDPIIRIELEEAPEESWMNKEGWESDFLFLDAEAEAEAEEDDWNNDEDGDEHEDEDAENLEWDKQLKTIVLSGDESEEFPL